MNVKTIADPFCERPAVPAPSHSAARLAGALPPVIGWAAATGDIGLEPLTLFLIIFLWTPPHFWALALNRSDDYARAGVPMLPVVAGRLQQRGRS